jgi:hypothetical protein
MSIADRGSILAKGDIKNPVNWIDPLKQTSVGIGMGNAVP